ncbi:MAG: hypothetical protein FGM63_06050 [Candidatus Nanopelagicaceae bacterium]|nr:hypothetical protein [Candidatus Nanopelagicaceae bacterium]
MNSTSLYESQISKRIIQILELSGALWVHNCLLEVTLREDMKSSLKYTNKPTPQRYCISD